MRLQGENGLLRNKFAVMAADLAHQKADCASLAAASQELSQVAYPIQMNAANSITMTIQYQAGNASTLRYLRWGLEPLRKKKAQRLILWCQYELNLL